MHFPAHMLVGWCAADALPLTARERFFCVLASILPDWDTVTLLHSARAYLRYHHVWGHNLLFGLLMSGGLALMARKGGWRRSAALFGLFLTLFHLHLAMDFLGSGYGWTIAYFWPFGDGRYEISWGWGFYDWKNYLVVALLALWTWWIYRRRRRGPFEYCAPKIDAVFLHVLAG